MSTQPTLIFKGRRPILGSLTCPTDDSAPITLPPAIESQPALALACGSQCQSSTIQEFGDGSYAHHSNMGVSHTAAAVHVPLATSAMVSPLQGVCPEAIAPFQRSFQEADFSELEAATDNLHQPASADLVSAVPSLHELAAQAAAAGHGGSIAASLAPLGSDECLGPSQPDNSAAAPTAAGCESFAAQPEARLAQPQPPEGLVVEPHAVVVEDIEEAFQLLDRCTRYRPRGLMVTDITAAEWCQAQVAYSMARPDLKVGTQGFRAFPQS